MVPTGILALVVSPLAIITAAVLIVSIVLVLALSLVLRGRRGAEPQRAGTVSAPERTAAQGLPAGRSIQPPAPADVQERLRRLTTGSDLPAESGAAQEAPARDHAAPPAVPASAPSVRVDAPRAATPATPSGAASADDATRFFGDGGPDLGATRFFGAEEEARDADVPDATRFFGESPDDSEPVHDATTFFGAEGDQGRPFSDATTFFGDDLTPGAPREPGDATRFFARDDLKTDDVPAAPADPERANLLRALPPALKGSVWDNVSSSSVLDTGGLNRIRECLASAALPDVLAVSVIDGAGRVLAGETDADLTGELRSLMAESGQGNTADVEQPVTLSDSSAGAIVLFPTGANALLGALVRDADDPQATRASLRGLANNIGDAIRRAS